MRWKTKEKVIPQYGETRIITKFLLLPKKLPVYISPVASGESYNYGEPEYRWLERAEILQRFGRFGWSNDCWL